MVHLILVAVSLILFFILSLILLPVEWIIGKISPSARDKSSLAIVQCELKLVLLAAGTRVTIIGRENIPKNTAVLYVGNHRSYFDVVISYCYFYGLTGFVAKKEMLKVPLLRNWMRNLHCVFLDRTDIKQGLKTILSAIDLMKSGISVCVFPEGTRSTGDDLTELLPFHEGSFKIASKSKCPIVPMAITNTAEIYEAHKPWVKAQHVTLEFLPPVYPEQLDKQDQRHLGVYTQNLICEALKKNMAAQ